MNDWQKALTAGARHRLASTLEGLDNGHLTVDRMEESMEYEDGKPTGKWSVTIHGTLNDPEVAS